MMRPKNSTSAAQSSPMASPSFIIPTMQRALSVESAISADVTVSTSVAGACPTPASAVLTPTGAAKPCAVLRPVADQCVDLINHLDSPSVCPDGEVFGLGDFVAAAAAAPAGPADCATPAPCAATRPAHAAPAPIAASSSLSSSGCGGGERGLSPRSLRRLLVTLGIDLSTAEISAVYVALGKHCSCPTDPAPRRCVCATGRVKFDEFFAWICPGANHTGTAAGTSTDAKNFFSSSCASAAALSPATACASEAADAAPVRARSPPLRRAAVAACDAPATSTTRCPWSVAGWSGAASADDAGTDREGPGCFWPPALPLQGTRRESATQSSQSVAQLVCERAALGTGGRSAGLAPVALGTAAADAAGIGAVAACQVTAQGAAPGTAMSILRGSTQGSTQGPTQRVTQCTAAAAAKIPALPMRAAAMRAPVCLVPTTSRTGGFAVSISSAHESPCLLQPSAHNTRREATAARPWGCGPAPTALVCANSPAFVAAVAVSSAAPRGTVSATAGPVHTQTLAQAHTQSHTQTQTQARSSDCNVARVAAAKTAGSISAAAPATAASTAAAIATAVVTSAVDAPAVAYFPVFGSGGAMRFSVAVPAAASVSASASAYVSTPAPTASSTAAGLPAPPAAAAAATAAANIALPPLELTRTASHCSDHCSLASAPLSAPPTAVLGAVAASASAPVLYSPTSAAGACAQTCGGQGSLRVHRLSREASAESNGSRAS